MKACNSDCRENGCDKIKGAHAEKLIAQFVEVCKREGGRQLTDEEFISEMQGLYTDCVNYGFANE
tara:strand:- start:621 stop:815 length:195 start_codon:yes stop_codon:yes gene_type:complete